MNISELSKYINQHGRIKYTNKLGEINTLYGFIREVNCESLLWEDNELPYKCKIRNVIEFKPMELPTWKH